MKPKMEWGIWCEENNQLYFGPIVIDDKIRIVEKFYSYSEAISAWKFYKFLFRGTQFNPQ